VHFAEGRDYKRAVQYLQMAAELATERYAYQETIDHLSRGLELLAALPNTPEKTRQERELQTALGSAQQAAAEGPTDVCEEAAE
jgi:predicted ATPase